MKSTFKNKSHIFIVCAAMIIPSISFASEHYKNPLWKDLLLAGLPFVFFGVGVWAAIKFATKKSNLANEQIIKQNAEIVKSLSEIVEILKSKA